MWRVVNTLVRRPYSYSESKNVAALIERFRTEPGTGAAAPAGGGAPGVG
jgi:hypothetical protein